MEESSVAIYDGIHKSGRYYTSSSALHAAENAADVIRLWIQNVADGVKHRLHSYTRNSWSFEREVAKCN